MPTQGTPDISYWKNIYGICISDVCTVEMVLTSQESSTPLGVTQCTYVKRAGRCPNQCYNGRCHTHKRSTSHTLCRNGCGRGTLSVTAFCNKCEPGQSGLQGFILQRMRRIAKLHPATAAQSAEAPELQRKRYDAELDACVDELLA